MVNLPTYEANFTLALTLDGAVLIDVSRRCLDGVSEIALSGELDGASAQSLASLLADEPLGWSVRLDLSAVTFVDCAGLRALVGLRRRSLAAGAAFEISATCRPLGHLLELLARQGIGGEHEALQGA